MTPLNVLTIVAIVVVILAVIMIIAFLVSYLRWRKALRGMDIMLDEALSGEFLPENYDEGQISKLEAKLARYLAAAKLRRSNLEEDKGKIHALISDISHQTKTPIANIQLYAGLLGEQPELTEHSIALADQLHSSADKLSFLIQSLIKSSRLEAGILQVKPKKQELYTLVATAAEEYRAKASDKNIELILPEENIHIKAKYDDKWCAEALGNILDNAIKYTPSNGNVVVTLHDYEMFACIRVTDSGKGIGEDDLPKIFGRFYRAADSSGDEGVGIGLYLAREIIGRCGGYIQVSSQLGQGSVFSIYLSKL